MRVRHFITFFIFISVLYIFSSCEEEYDYWGFSVPSFDATGKDTIPTTCGLQYIIISEGNGEQPDTNDKVKIKVHHVGHRSGTGSFTPYNLSEEKNVSFIVGKTAPVDGMSAAVTYMKTGGKYKVIIPPDQAFGADPFYEPITGAGVWDPYSTLLYDIELLEVKQPVSVEPFDTSGKDTVEVEDTGLRYIVVTTGEGDELKDDSKVVIEFTGYLEDGTIFNSSALYNDREEFKISESPFPEALENGLVLMKKGAKYRFILSPEIAYGRSGGGIIPPNASLFYDIHLIDVK
jgi:FKBP-type peptidyl-prolyl cis-trans isomerase